MICRPCGTCVARTARRGCARSSLKAAGPTLTCPYVMDGAGEGNRTLMTSLEGWRSAIELRPRARQEPMDGPPGRHRQRTGCGTPAPNPRGQYSDHAAAHRGYALIWWESRSDEAARPSAKLRFREPVPSELVTTVPGLARRASPRVGVRSVFRVLRSRLLVGRGVNDGYRVEADLLGDPGQQLVLRGEVALHVRHFVQGRARVVECRLGALVRCGSLHVLPDHDDRQQHQLQEGLCHPGDDLRRAAMDRVRQTDQVE